MKVSELVNVIDSRAIIEFIKEHTNLLADYEICKDKEVAMLDSSNSDEVVIYFK